MCRNIQTVGGRKACGEWGKLKHFSQWIGPTCSSPGYVLMTCFLLARWCWSLRAWRWSSWGLPVTCRTSTWLAIRLWKRLFLAAWNFCRPPSIQRITGWWDYFKCHSSLTLTVYPTHGLHVVFLCCAQVCPSVPQSAVGAGVSGSRSCQRGPKSHSCQ